MQSSKVGKKRYENIYKGQLNVKLNYEYPNCNRERNEA